MMDLQEAVLIFFNFCCDNDKHLDELDKKAMDKIIEHFRKEGILK